MTILIVEDDIVSRRMLETMLTRWGYSVRSASNGLEAWNIIKGNETPDLIILDWMMPGIDGIELCKRVRSDPTVSSAYIILLTAKGKKEDIVVGLSAGADDYITKPFDREELKARVQVGARTVDLQEKLSERVKQLEEALAHVKQLQGFLPICSYCKKIRNDANYWQKVEQYIEEHAEVKFSHSICPECYEKYVKPQLDAIDEEETKEISDGRA